MTHASAELAITPKRLGLICIPSFCPRCFWYLLRMKFHPPFDRFGGAIFKQMEQAQMAVIGNLLDNNGCLPKPFEPFCDVVDRVDFPRDWRKFRHRLDSGVLLQGEPDDIFALKDKSIAIVDHKTANPRNGADPLIELYRCQVIGYALIAEAGLRLGKVSKGGLFYWSAASQDVISNPSSFYRNNQLWVAFNPKPVVFEIDYDYLKSPLKEAVRLWNLESPPERSQGCSDCRKLDALFALENEVAEQTTCRDMRAIATSGNDPWVRENVTARRYRHMSARSDALMELRSEAASIKFADDGMIANWYD
jgi:PD-(D/E)XK nuclease superfamily